MRRGQARRRVWKMGRRGEGGVVVVVGEVLVVVEGG